MYNSAIFSTVSTQQYSIFTVYADFLTESSLYTTTTPGGTYDDTTLRSLNWLHDNISSLTKLDNAACIRAYGHDYVSSYGDLLLVLSARNAANSLLFHDLSLIPEITLPNDSFDWICAGNPDIRYVGFYRLCSADKAAAKASEWTIQSHSIDYCLSRKNEEHCRLQFSLIVMIGVILSNLVKMICMIVTV